MCDTYTPGIAPAQTDNRHRKHIAEQLPPVAPNAILNTRPVIPSINLDYKAVAATIKENINYAGLLQFARVRQSDGFCYSKGDLDKVVSCMTSAICCKSPTMRVNGTKIPTDVVCERMLTLDSDHILSALRGIWAVESEGGEIGNKRAYLQTVLFNSIEAV